MKLKDKLKQWLFKEELEQLQTYKKDIEEFKANIRSDISNYERNYFASKLELRDAQEEYKTAKKLVNEIVDVGVDVHMKSSGSWAVLCIDGNPQYMKFVRFERDNIREIQRFLKNFEYSKHVIDAPMLPQEFWLKW